MNGSIELRNIEINEFSADFSFRLATILRSGIIFHGTISHLVVSMATPVAVAAAALTQAMRIILTETRSNTRDGKAIITAGNR